MIPALSHFSALAPAYDAVVCDVWGVVHNGLDAYDCAVDALTRYRAQGGTVLLLSNAARPEASLRAQLTAMGAGEAAYDTILSSGDASRIAVQEAQAQGGLRLFHLGPARNTGIFEGLDVTLTGPEDATLVLNSGLVNDDHETPEDYRDLLAALRARSLPMLCANPDLQAERGPRFVWCAGALARDYEALGGQVTYLGKPHPPIFAMARARLGEVMGRAPRRVLAIGDGLRTDIAGANRAGLDVLLITAGLHADAFGADPLSPDPAKVASIMEAARLTAIGYQPRLRW
jgi:HAD superfamily hydrolase (TIGR01459 family)